MNIFVWVTKMLNDGPYQKVLKNPLNKFISSIEEAINNCNLAVPKNERLKFLISNPVSSRLYWLPKIR